MRWTPERKEFALRMWVEGKSAGEIAKAFGDVSRNSVIGLVFRAGLSRDIKQGPTRCLYPKVRAAKPAKLFLVGDAVFVSRPPRAARAIAKDAVFLPLPGSTPRHFMDRPTHGCRWPIGDDLLSCCEPTLNHHYCPEHRAVSIAQTQPKHPSKPPMLRSGVRAAA